MANPAPPSDAPAREQALDPAGSFIVQAPAGSGKTELLIQRFLRLLAEVDAPEEVVAITFTRKASGEMRRRVLNALDDAEARGGGGEGSPPASGHAAVTQALAAAVLERDAAREWRLRSAPARLRIQTFDAFSASITRQRPWLSRFGGQPATSERLEAVFLQAAHAVLRRLGQKGEDAAAVARLLTHLDNDQGRAAELLRATLTTRDQWLRHLRRHPREEMRDALEAALRQVIAAGLRRVAALVPEEIGTQLPPLAVGAARQLEREGGASPILAWKDAPPAMPRAEVEVMEQWQGLVTLLLTGKNDWRKSVDKQIGFPPESAGKNAEQKGEFAQRKRAFTNLLKRVTGNEPLREALAAVRALPLPAYPDAQWEVLDALLTLLPTTVDALRRAFAEAGEVDFSEVAMAAVAALEEAGGEQGDALDYPIRHLLVDEFQDTSHSQHALLEAVTRGWRAGDGRTLFVVGDPMQSIYRFREAEVGLYLRAWEEGLAGLPLTPLRLEVNFRSEAGIVEWLNARFPAVLPPAEDVATGAVPYVPFRAAHPAGPAPAVRPHAVLTRAAEAARVVEIVRTEQAADPRARIAILVRARGHLLEIMPALRAAGLPFRAIEIDALAQRSAVQDLWALTRALHHPADRVAWLAVLRAPWCGLELADLLALAGGNPYATLWSAITGPAAEALSAEGRGRLARLREALAPALAQRHRRALRAGVEGAWWALGGPAGLEPTALEDARAYLELLERLGEEDAALDQPTLAAELERLYAPPDLAAGEGLQIMSIHKAKGLEFDVVILPGLGRWPGRADPKLLHWAEVTGETSGEASLLLAPIQEAGMGREPIHEFLADLDKRREAHETGRLLYVALTRARRQLHLLGEVGMKDGAVQTPHANTLLRRLWHAVEGAFRDQLTDAPSGADTAETAPEPLPPPLRRLEPAWRAPALAATVGLATDGAGAGAAEAHAPEYLWAGETARHVGTVVHAALQRIAQAAERGAALPDAERVAAMAPAFGHALTRLGVGADERAAATERVATAVAQTLSDERGQWLLRARPGAESELALTAPIAGRPTRFVIDRTLVDEEGVRWIVDYKTGSHEGGGLDAFLASEQERYRGQLESYAEVMRRRDPAHPIRLGLYFPLLQAFRTWDASSAQGQEPRMNTDGHE